jgi:hypothetical protein
MSLDFYLKENFCTHCQRGDEVAWKNITHNLGGMWRAANVYDALYESAGKKASEIVDALQRGLADMIKRPEFYRRFDAPNGWGTYEHAVPWLREVLDMCERNPNAIIRVCR